MPYCDIPIVKFPLNSFLGPFQSGFPLSEPFFFKICSPVARYSFKHGGFLRGDDTGCMYGFRQRGDVSMNVWVMVHRSFDRRLACSSHIIVESCLPSLW